MMQVNELTSALAHASPTKRAMLEEEWIPEKKLAQAISSWNKACQEKVDAIVQTPPEIQDPKETLEVQKSLLSYRLMVEIMTKTCSSLTQGVNRILSLQ